MTEINRLQFRSFKVASFQCLGDGCIALNEWEKLVACAAKSKLLFLIGSSVLAASESFGRGVYFRCCCLRVI